MDKNNNKSYWEKRLSIPELGIEHVGHSGLGFTYNHWLYNARFAAMDRVIKRLTISIEDKSLLEMGVGSGAWTSYWKSRRIKELTGVDITSASVKYLKRKYPLYKFFQADITQDLGEVQGHMFDLVTAFDVLFHIVDELGFQRSVFNIMHYLKRGGLAIISDSFCGKPWGPTLHEYHRSYDQYAFEFEQVGLIPLHIEPIYFTMTTPLCTNKSFLSKPYARIVSSNLRIIRKIASKPRLERFNNIIGCFLYMIDRILGSVLPTGPSLKILTLRKT